MRFFPKNYNFFKLFDQQASYLYDTVKVLRDLEEKKDAVRAARKIKKIENNADEVTHEIIKTLNKTFITPIEREDIALLAGNIDDVIDGITKALNRLHIYQINPIPEEVYKYNDLIDEGISEIAHAIKEMSNPRKRQEVLGHCTAINHIENKADEIHRATLSKLMNNSTDAILVIKLKEIYDSLEKVSDYCENVANTIETIMIKNF